jgi:molybdenum cofactor synthesis domain-containing protein
VSPLVPLDEVRAEILAAVGVLTPVAMASTAAAGLVLAADVIAPEAVPPFANSAMDGFAVRAVDTVGATADLPVELLVVGVLPAGRAPDVEVGAGQAVRIMTGAPMPDGADAVVMVEQTRPIAVETVGVERVGIEAPATPGDHVRAAGGDLMPGQLVFAGGTRLGAAHIGVLASIGTEAVSVFPRPKVGVLSTGDELRGNGELTPGTIRDSNRPMLLELVREAGMEPVDLGIARDDEDLITDTLRDALAGCDAVLTSGGVSMGDYDYVKAALDRLGSLQWRQVAIKPAKPLAFGVINGTPVFGLPGNPVSSLVSFELFARPALLQLAGDPCRFRPEVVARASAAFRRALDGKVHLDRVRVRWAGDGYLAASTGSQASNVLSATALANGLAIVPDGVGIEAGEPVTVMLLDAAPDH